MVRKAKKPTRPAPVEYDGTTPLRDPKQEFFCELFTTNTLPNFWGNGGTCYSFAYGFDDRITELQRQIDGTKKDRKGKSKVSLEREIEKIHNTCRSSATRLLTNANTKLRCGALLDKLASHTIVDRELVYLIEQRKDNDAKIRAIEHHDKREQRIRERVDIKHEFEPIKVITIKEPVAK